MAGSDVTAGCQPLWLFALRANKRSLGKWRQKAGFSQGCVTLLIPAKLQSGITYSIYLHTQVLAVPIPNRRFCTLYQGLWGAFGHISTIFQGFLHYLSTQPSILDRNSALPFIAPKRVPEHRGTEVVCYRVVRKADCRVVRCVNVTNPKPLP